MTPGGKRVWAPGKRPSRRRVLLRRATRVADALRDRMRGIETRGLPADAHPDPARGHSYSPSGWGALGTLLDPSEVAASDVFLDVGCGKGRVLLDAIRYPFARIDGIEVSAQLAATAQSNVAHVLGQGSPRVRVTVGDACDLDLADDVTVLYLFNPFHAERFERFLDRVDASIARHPRRLRILYLQPTMHEQLRRRGFEPDRLLPDRARYHRPAA